MVKQALSILSWVGVALVFGAVGVRLLRPEWDQYAIYAVWAGFALVVLYSLGQWREVAAYFRRRNARYGAVATVGVIAAIAVLVAVNYLAAREHKRWDLTANQRFTLSDQTVNLLKGLQAPVKFLVFGRTTDFDRFRARLDEYAYQSKQVQVEYIDADRRPVETRNYNITEYGTVVVEYMGRREQVKSNEEQDLTNALIKVLNPQHRKVYFLAGHGEKDPTSGDERIGYSAVDASLKQDNYEVASLVLAQTRTVPADATEVVIAGPKTDLLESEVQPLRDYLAKGGKLLVLLDPPDDLKQPASPASLPNLTGLLHDWGFDVPPSVVVDLSGLTNVATFAVAAPPYPPHGITERFNLLTVFPMARAVLPAKDAPDGRVPQSFAQTGARSWAETTFSQLENTDALALEPEKGDIAGPVSIAAAVSAPVAGVQPTAGETGAEAKVPDTRVVVIGDSDFAENAYIGAQGNRDLFMNTVNWVAGQENLISIRPRPAGDRRISLTAGQATAVFWGSVVLIPLAVFAAGIWTWYRRR